MRIDGDAGAGELADQLVDVGLGADVDASGRLVEDQHRRLDVEPLGEHHLLLVAARQVADRRRSATGVRMPQALAVDLGGPPLGRAVDEPPSGHEAAQAGQRDVGGDRLRQRQAEPAAVLRDVGDAVGHRLAWRGDLHLARRRAGSTPSSAGCTPNIASATSVRPDPTSPAKPSTSPSRTSNETSSKAPWRPRPSTLQGDVARLVRHPPEEVGELAPDHVADQRRPR